MLRMLPTELGRPRQEVGEHTGCTRLARQRFGQERERRAMLGARIPEPLEDLSTRRLERRDPFGTVLSEAGEDVRDRARGIGQ